MLIPFKTTLNFYLKSSQFIDLKTETNSEFEVAIYQLFFHRLRFTGRQNLFIDVASNLNL